MKRFSVEDARFDGSLVIENSSFEGGFQFQNAGIKEDLLVNAKSSNSNKMPAFQIRDTHVDGRTEIATVTSGSVDNLKTGDLHVVAGNTVDGLSFAHLDVNSLRIDGAVTRTGVRQLYTTNSKINNAFRVAGDCDGNFPAGGGQRVQCLLFCPVRIDAVVDL